MNNLSTILDAIASFWNLIVNVVTGISIFDIIDIIVVTYLIYKCICFFRDTRATQLVKGILILFAVWVLSQWFNLVTMKWLLYKLFDSALIVAVILFHPELRRALERVGRSKLGLFNRNSNNNEDSEKAISAICKAAGNMQDQKIGALIVCEKNTQLGEIVNTGTVIDADVSSTLISSIFFPNSPLHDGAIIIRDGKIVAAGCILPLVQNDGLNNNLGTRHRAAIGISEASDAVVIVVSEETGTISIAENGVLDRNFNTVTLFAELSKRLIPTEEQSKDKNILSFFKKIFKKEDDSDNENQE